MKRDMVLKKTSALAGAMVIMTAAWSFMHLPGSNLTMMTFALLSSSVLCSIPDFKRRAVCCFQMICGAAATQFLIGITAKHPEIRILVSMLFSFFILAVIADRQAAVIILLIAYLSIFAPPGVTAAVNRCADIAFAGIAALTVSSLCNISAEDMPEKTSSSPLPLRNAAIVTAELTAGNIIAQIIDHEQMAWIMLTILFIHLAESPQTPPADLAGKRVIATLPGIILGGMYLSAFCSVNYRMIYIVPFSGVLSFFVLYLKNDYFLFTLLFMFSVTLFADWLPGNGRGFVFTEMMFVRSLAAVIGAVLLLCGENLMQKEMVS